jgi:hypothetical protein
MTDMEGIAVIALIGEDEFSGLVAGLFRSDLCSGEGAIDTLAIATPLGGVAPRPSDGHGVGLLWRRVWRSGLEFSKGPPSRILNTAGGPRAGESALSPNTLRAKSLLYIERTPHRERTLSP